LKAREQYAAGNLVGAEFKRLEDRAVDQCIAIQERVGVDVVTDGEMRRQVFASQLAEACEGFASIPNNQVDWFTLEGRVETSSFTVGLGVKFPQAGRKSHRFLSNSLNPQSLVENITSQNNRHLLIKFWET
jgi:methionine synthase II (cobalamin-independent)